MQHTDAEQLRDEISALRQRAEEKRAKRLANGQQPNPPEPFIDVVLSAALYKRVFPIFEYGKKAGVLLASDVQVPIDPAQFDKYATDLNLLRMSVDKRYRNHAYTGLRLINAFKLYAREKLGGKDVARVVYDALIKVGLANSEELDDIRRELRQIQKRKGVKFPDYKKIEKQADELLNDSARFKLLHEEALNRFKKIERELDDLYFEEG
jgi:hypothetical protein